MSVFFVFFFKQKSAYEMRISDCSSDVCSSDLLIKSYLPGSFGVTVAHNASRTIHRGLEAGLSGALRLATVPGSLEGELAYTFNDFRFSDDPAYGSNRHPGIPRHVGRIDVIYRHPQGYYRSEERREGKGWVSTSRYRWSPTQTKKKKKRKN